MKRIVLILIAGFALIAAFDIGRRPSGDLRRFDPKDVARLETGMWRDYYDHRKAALFFRLASMLRAQFGQPLLRSRLPAFHAARAAFLFQDGNSRASYEKALPDLRAYYAAVLSPGANAVESARLELEWWIVHRERAAAPDGALERALAELQAEIHGMPASTFTEHARLRAEAMLPRDRKAGAGGVAEADWVRIRDLLDGSWTSLWRAVTWHSASVSTEAASPAWHTRSFHAPASPWHSEAIRRHHGPAQRQPRSRSGPSPSVDG